ncbi:MAG: MBL fold metallo-hydrolase [Kiritimatiellae bacterium]|nr:MBL fold metallo-hydrolase [Kiritimatiellia bacterium]MBQ3344015.1 MBL fold metallo-hydrolase [Kiritimatiellia bacterium]MBQ6330840.1 MBL fold metallo-hydrolase [Kiritimatiellia bacterium]
MTIRDDIRYVGVNDHEVDLFEGQYVVPRGMAYNSYLVKDGKTLVFDTVDQNFGEAWLANIRAEIGDAPVDYLVVQHMEPDHSANIAAFAAAYPDATIVASAQAFAMMKNFFGTDYADRRLVVKEGDTLSTGRHTFAFVAAPMVHWPEVIVTYDTAEKVLFSADAFGKFGANDVEDPEGWDCEARRYYIGIVGKYGPQAQALLKKAAGLEIRTICPLHGPVLSTAEEIAHAVKQYDTWSSYAVESPGVCIAYTSVYGHTKAAVMKLRELLLAKGCPKVAVSDLARDDQPEAVEDAFRYGKLVLATTTYNMDVFPWMRHFIDHLTERNYQKRSIGFVENGSWAPSAAKVMKGMFAKSKDIVFLDPVVTIRGALDAGSEAQLEALAEELVK